MANEVLTFTGVSYPRSLWGQNTLGTVPDIYALEFVPQAGAIPNNGTSTLVFGNESVLITLTNCYIDSMRYTRNSGGSLVTAFIWDRRWLWQRQIISGRYNVRRPDGTVDPATEKTPRELATLLLTAIGEGSTVVTALPNGDRPEVNWDNADVADTLYDLLRQRGCAIGIPNNTTTIFAIGSGTGAPANTDVISVQQNVDPPELPATLRLVCRPTVIQSKLKLIPVIPEYDGEIVELDDCSFKPAGGWEVVQNWLEFPEIDDVSNRAIAQKYAGKLFRIDSQADGSQYIDGFDPVPGDASELLPLSTKLLEVYSDLNGKQRASEATLEGTYAVVTEPAGELVNTDDFTEYVGGWRLFGETGLVLLEDPAIRLDTATNEWKAANLYLICTYSVLDPDTRQYYREQFDRALGGTGTIAFKSADLYRTIQQVYEDPYLDTVASTVDNYTDLETAAEAVLDSIAARFVSQTGFVVFYRNIQSVFANGVIFQVQYRAGIKKFFTTAAVATESIVSVPREVERYRRRVARANSNYLVADVEDRRRMEVLHWR